MFTTRPELHGVFGVVASTHWLASQHAMAVLEKGGNAFDAAVVGGFVLQVVEPHLNGPLGDMPAIIYPAKERRARIVCGQGPAPAKATIARMKSFGLDVIPGSGLLAPCVPGATDAWLLMLRDYGTISLEEALQPAIELAGGGYPVVDHMTRTIDSVAALFRDEWITSAAIWLDHGTAPRPGRRWQNLAQANFYQSLIAAGDKGDRETRIDGARSCLKTGFIAEEIDRFCETTEAMDVSGERHSGLLTGDDLARWSASFEEPLSLDFGPYTVVKPGAWSQGPVFLQQLALLDGMGLEDMDPLGADFIHTVTEAAKLAYADREAFYGDPNFVDVPIKTLLSSEYNAERRKLIDPELASLQLLPGMIEGFGNRIGEGRSERSFGPGVGEPTMDKIDGQTSGPVDGDTCHIDVIDKNGNMVSATPSGGWLQSSPAIPKLGVCLGTRAQMFWLDEGLPGSLAPGKRPRTTLSPSFALRDGEPYMPFGTPGGDGQDQWTLIFFLRHILHGFNLQEAIDAPTFQSHHFPSSFFPRQAEPGRLVLEGRYPAKTLEELKRRGHLAETAGPWTQGRISACAKDGELLKAAANPRLMQGYAVGR
ncbi:MAG: gamma-glutamyltransferase family protein [Alphaproteobacteria bacterium]|jgi:gamma-glutamyltranspeptidase/glutathione hydrolase